jgi:hypothetical protein
MDSKPWYASSGVWGGILAVVAPLIGVLLHKTVSSADITAVSDALAAIGGAVGGLIAVYGRVNATTTIGTKP